MPPTFASCFAAWKNSAGSPACPGIYMTAASFTAASLALLLAPRTFLGSAFAPHPAWALPFAVLAGLPLLLLVEPGISPAARVWRWSPALLLLSPLVPQPFQVGLILAAAAGLFCWSSRPALYRLAGRYAEMACLWLVVLLTSAAYRYFAARWTDWEVGGLLLAGVARLLGASGVSAGGRFHLQHESVAYPIGAGPDKFGGEFVALLVASLCFVGIARRVPLVRLTAAVTLVVAFALLRGVWLLAANAVSNAGLRWWDEATTLGSFLPLGLLLVPILAVPRTAPPPRRIAASRAAWFPVGAAAALCLALGWFWVDPGTAKRGAVMIDERYSRWEWSEAPLDTRLYGVKTVYSYYCMMEALGHYFPVRRNFADITDQTLKEVSVLILKTPTEAYPPEARAAIWRFVDRGGGLWLVSDHTDIFGISSYLNEVASRYGIRFATNAVVDPGASRVLFQPDSLSHPIVRRMPLFLWYTGCSIEPTWASRDVIRTARLLVDDPDYSQNTAFGNFVPDLHEPVRPVVQAAALEAGAGRVALWSDSTLFSNFAIFLPGKMELVLGTINWLNRSNRRFPVREPLLAAGALLLVAACLLAPLDLLALGAWVGLCAAVPLVKFTYDRGYPQLQPRTPFRWVAFLEPPSEEHVPVSSPSDDEPQADSYLTAFVAVQRVGKRPVVVKSVEAALRADTVVLVHTHLELSAVARDRLLGWVRRGGHLVILDGGSGSLNSLERLIAPARLRPAEESPPTESLRRLGAGPRHPPGGAGAHRLVELAGQPVGQEAGIASIGGGSPRVVSEDRKSVFVAEIPLGKGLVVASSTRALFSDQNLGGSSTVPTASQLTMLQLLYRWYGQSGDHTEVVAGARAARVNGRTKPSPRRP